MLVKLAEWERVAEQFTEEERTRLTLAVRGECHRPRGLYVNLDEVPLPVANKLHRALADVRPHVAAAVGG